MLNDDPRNIFVNQHNAQYSNKDERSQSTANSSSSNGQIDDKVAQMKKLAEKYQKEGEGQLLKDLIDNVIEQKAKGQLTNEQLNAFAKRISPLLNAEQRQRLGQLLDQLLKL